jgi:hypothetical protein
VHGDCLNHCTSDEPIRKQGLQHLGGFAVHGSDVGHGVFHNSIFIDKSFDVGVCKSNNFAHSVSHGNDVNNAGPILDSFMDGPLNKGSEDAFGSLSLGKKEGRNLVDIQCTMRDASSMKSTGESCVDEPPTFDIPIRTFSLIENDSVSHCPTIEEVIAFGGIPKPTTGVRSSTRLGGQPNADMPQLEKAMKKAQLRDESFTSGQLAIPMHSIINIPDSKIVKRADRLGRSLGNSAGEIGKSIKGLKMVEAE